MKNFLQEFLGNRVGASAAEYALILAVLGSAVVIGILALSEGFSAQMILSKNAIEKDYNT